MDPNTQNEPTFGEKRVRTTFNPSNDTVVQHIKERYAELINYINDNVKADTAETARLKALALTETEGAAMWSVKAATA